MENKTPSSAFQYTYSAEKQDEIKKIREKYAPETKEEDKLERLRRLDRQVTEKAQIISLVLGIVGVLILGFGMSICMTDIGAIFGSAKYLGMTVGIIIGIIGAAIAGVAYPAYTKVLNHEKAKAAPEILKLTDELMGK